MSELKKEELTKLQKQAMREFYFRPSYILRKLFRTKSLEEIRQLFRGFKTLMKFQMHKYHE